MAAPSPLERQLTADAHLLSRLDAKARRPLYRTLLMQAPWALALLAFSQWLIHFLPGWLQEHRLALCYHNGRLWLPAGSEMLPTLMRPAVSMMLLSALCLLVLPLAEAVMLKAFHRILSGQPAWPAALTPREQNAVRDLLGPPAKREWPTWLAATGWMMLQISLALLLLHLCSLNGTQGLQLCRHESPAWTPVNPGGPWFVWLPAGLLALNSLVLPAFAWSLIRWRRRMRQLIRRHAPAVMAAVTLSPAAASPTP